MTKSRTGKHAARKIVIVYTADGERRVYWKPAQNMGKGTYSRGIAGIVEVPENAEYVVLAYLVRNGRGHVKGWISVYSSRGDELLKVKLYRRKLRRSFGDSSLKWIIDDVISVLQLEDYIRRVNLNTGVGLEE
jgi:hypothetical protein